MAVCINRSLIFLIISCDVDCALGTMADSWLHLRTQSGRRGTRGFLQSRCTVRDCRYVSTYFLYVFPRILQPFSIVGSTLGGLFAVKGKYLDRSLE